MAARRLVEAAVIASLQLRGVKAVMNFPDDAPITLDAIA